MCQRKSKELSVPFVTYAEDRACAVGYHLLMYGDVHLANECSFVGNVGFRVTPWMMKHFLAELEIKARVVHKGENKVRLNPLEEFTDKDKEWFLDILRSRVNAIANFAARQRRGKPNVGDPEKFEGTLAEGRFYFG